MGRTLAEKILCNKSASDLKAGDITIGMADLIFVQDTTSPLAVQQFEAIGFKGLSNLGKALVFLDHATPSPSRGLSNDQLVLESYASPGEKVVKDELESDLAAALSATWCGLVDYFRKYGDFEVRNK